MTDKERREVTWLPEGIDPMPGVPKVRVLDEDGKEVLRGYYFRHENRQPALLGDQLRPEDVDHCVVYDGLADWNMPKQVKMAKITPPHRIEVLGGIDRDDLLDEVKELEKCAWYFGLDFDEDEPLRDRLKEASEDFAGSARRIREALGVEQ